MKLFSALRTKMLILCCISASAFVGGAASGDDMPIQRSQMAMASFRLEYQNGLPRVLPALNNTHDKYLGSGAGTAEGQIVGRVDWDLYENQDNPTLHRTTFVGRISAPGGGSIRFETDGYFVPRAEATAFWDLASAVYFFNAAGPTYRWLEGRIGVWQGFMDSRNGYSHSYKLILNEQ